MAVKNHNFCFNMEKDNEVSAWGILHSRDVREDLCSQNELVISAINDYYDRHLAKKQDPYLESREKEESFTQNIVKAVEQKVLEDLPGLAAVYMMQQQVQAEMPMQAVGQEQSVTGDKGASGNMDYTEEDVKKYQMDPDINELLDFSFCGE